MIARAPLVALALLALGCGASTPPTARPSDGWYAHPPTESATCGTPLGACAHGASLRVRWPGETRALDSRITLDGEPIEGAEVELGACVAPGVHRLVIDTALDEPDGTVARVTASANIEILAGIETRVALSRAPGGLGLAGTMFPTDLGVTVSSLADELPGFSRESTPEERRLFVETVAAMFERWRARLARITALARELRDPVLFRATTEHESRAESLAGAFAETRPSADRVDAILRGMRTEIEDSSSMLAIDRTCPVYRGGATDAPLAPVSVEARPYTSSAVFVARMRVAIDEVEVLDHGSPSGEELFEHTVAEGLVPAGDHLVVVEAIFAPRGAGPSSGGARRVRVFREQRVTIPAGGARIRVRARDPGPATAELEARLEIEITAPVVIGPADPSQLRR